MTVMRREWGSENHGAVTDSTISGSTSSHSSMNTTSHRIPRELSATSALTNWIQLPPGKVTLQSVRLTVAPRNFQAPSNSATRS